MRHAYSSSPEPPRLYAQTVGQGEDLILLHGWGMHSGIWEDTVEALCDDYRVTILDLPGHGYSRDVAVGPTLQALTRAVAAVVPKTPAIWLGWSLGGLIAQRLAIDCPERMSKLILVGSSPCFVRRPGWFHAMDLAVLHQFADSLNRDYRAAMKRFLALEVHGSDHVTEQLRVLRDLVFQHGEPDCSVLHDGLLVLQETDLRAELHHIDCPVLVLLGRRDNLVPPNAGTATCALLPNARSHTFERAAHAPFFSHPQEFIEQLRWFLND
ncbi:MAG: pimeloyl-ACP methyl ester esterase BioH [Candidatus Competibacteraceae bacterium]|nr:pimeloyl-ACP methyl ester esterase BioH [Candidatus Competibacteraceae bacterium]